MTTDKEIHEAVRMYRARFNNRLYPRTVAEFVLDASAILRPVARVQFKSGVNPPSTADWLALYAMCVGVEGFVWPTRTTMRGRHYLQTGMESQRIDNLAVRYATGAGWDVADIAWLCHMHFLDMNDAKWYTQVYPAIRLNPYFDFRVETAPGTSQMWLSSVRPGQARFTHGWLEKGVDPVARLRDFVVGHNLFGLRDHFVLTYDGQRLSFTKPGTRNQRRKQ